MPWYTVIREVLALSSEALPVVLDIIRAVRASRDQTEAAETALDAIRKREQAAGEAAWKASHIAGPSKPSSKPRSY